MRKLIVVAVVVALALLVVPAAFAGNGNGGSRKAVVNYSLSGNVTAVDADNGAVSVTFAKADKAARAYKGKTVDLKVATATLLYERTADGERVAVTLADITAGDRITSTGKPFTPRATGAFSAKRITIALPIRTCLTTGADRSSRAEERGGGLFRAAAVRLFSSRHALPAPSGPPSGHTRRAGEAAAHDALEQDEREPGERDGRGPTGEGPGRRGTPAR